MSQLEDLLQKCTVKLTLPGRTGWGTGFFVAPNWILTCAHGVQAAKGELVQVRWQSQELEATVERSLPDPYDLALLRLTPSPDANLPCVYLDEAIQSRDPLCLFGYPDEGDREGEPRTFNCDGITGSAIPSILFNLGQVRPGMSGSPLLNQRTGKVCGMVKFTRSRSIDLGGGAIPTHVILEQFPHLRELQREFHECDRQWKDLVAKLPNIADTSHSLDSSVPMTQTNFDGRHYRTQTGANSTNIIGGVYNYHGDASQVKLAVKKILMLSANPDNPELDRRNEEIREIENALDRATTARSKQGKYDAIFESPPLDKLNIRATDISQEISTIQPSIICISGNEDGIEKLILESVSTKNKPLNSEKLIADFFHLYSESIDCIILNGCYSEEQAREIAQHVKCVIGINRNLKHKKIIEFLSEFYYQLNLDNTITIQTSYHISRNRLERIDPEDIQLLPTLLEKEDEEKRRELEEKLSSCNEKIEKDENNVELWRKKADLLKKIGRSEEADEAYERASLLAPTNYEIRIEQGNALELFGRHEEAVDAYDKALELQKEDYTVWWKKGQALVVVGKYDEAVESYEKAVSLEPPSPDNYVICREYGSILKKLEQYQKSIILYKKSLGFEPRYRASSYEKRQVYKKMYFGKG